MSLNYYSVQLTSMQLYNHTNTQSYKHTHTHTHTHTIPSPALHQTSQFLLECNRKFWFAHMSSKELFLTINELVGQRSVNFFITVLIVQGRIKEREGEEVI